MKPKTPQLDILKHGIAEVEKSVAKLAKMYASLGWTFDEKDFMPSGFDVAARRVAAYQRWVEQEIEAWEGFSRYDAEMVHAGEKGEAIEKDCPRNLTDGPCPCPDCN